MSQDTADVTVTVVGPGRMGSAISQVFATAGHEVRLLDTKDRTPRERQSRFDGVRDTVESNLDFLAEAEQFDGAAATVWDRIECTADIATALCDTDWVFEALPEDPELKTDFLGSVTDDMPTDTIVATTTSSISLETLAPVAPDPAHLLITHWLNPAFLVPLVEVARSDETEETAIDATVDLLDSVGKEPVVCQDSPGFIGSRVQAAAMNEAVRAFEEGVATPDDIDTALQSGVGFRMAAMGLIEFVDFGGVDILYSVDEYLSEELGDRFDPPASVREKMERGERGLDTGRGYYDYDDVDREAVRTEKYRVMLALRETLAAANNR